MSDEYKLHPVDVISQAQQKIAFLADAIFSDDFEFSVTGQNGLYLLLRGIEDELKDAVNRLTEPSPEDTRRTLKLRTEKKPGEAG